jgi:hypothetical protein
MAVRPTITTLSTNAPLDIATLNTNFNNLQVAFDAVLGLPGTSGTSNLMTGDLDMGNNVIRNAQLNLSDQNITVTFNGVESINAIDGDNGNISIVAGTSMGIVNDAGAKTITLNATAPLSIDGVSNNGGDIDLVASTGMTITPDDGANTITFSTTGQANTVTNVGAGTGLLYKQKVGADLEFRSILAGTGMGVTNNTSDITLTPDVQTGTALTSGSGTEADVFKALTSGALQFRALKQGSNITLTENANDVTIAASGSVGETNTSSVVGTGLGKIFKQKSGVDFEFKSIAAGTNITVVNGTDDVTISASGSVGESNTASNVGTGDGNVFKQKTGVDLELKTILGGSGITVTDNTSDVTIALTSNQRIYNVKDDGATGDGSTDDTANINTTITSLLANAEGGILYFPPGDYKITSKLTITRTSDDQSVIVMGDGAQLSRLQFEGAIDGIDIVIPDSTKLAGDKSIVMVKDLAFTINQTGTQVAIKYSCVAGSSNGPLKMIKDCTFAGSAAANYWGTAINYDEATFTSVVNCEFYGDLTATGGLYSGTGILLSGAGTGSAFPVDHFIRGCKFHMLSRGVDVTELIEGVYITQVAMVLVRTGVKWNTTSGKPLLSITGSHINASEFCINMNYCQQFVISGNLLYGDVDAASAWVGININNVSGNAAGGQISDNILINNTAVTANGIVLSTTAAAGSCMIVHNKIQAPDTGIWLKSGSTGNYVLDNVVLDQTANTVLDDGTSNTVREPSTLTSFKGALAYRNTDQTVVTSTDTDISWQTTDYDTGSFVSGTEITIPSGVSRVRITSQVKWTANGNGDRILWIEKSPIAGGGYTKSYPGVGYSGQDAAVTNFHRQTATTGILSVSTGDKFKVRARQNSGISLDLVTAGSSGSTREVWVQVEVIE